MEMEMEHRKILMKREKCLTLSFGFFLLLLMYKNKCKDWELESGKEN